MVDVYWFSEQPYGYVTEDDLAPYESGRMHFPNTHFDPEKAHVLYNQYHEQYAWADEVGFDGIMSNEHHASYWVTVQPVKTGITPPLAIPSHRQEGETGRLRRAERLHERQ